MDSIENGSGCSGKIASIIITTEVISHIDMFQILHPNMIQSDWNVLNITDHEKLNNQELYLLDDGSPRKEVILRLYLKRNNEFYDTVLYAPYFSECASSSTIIENNDSIQLLLTCFSVERDDPRIILVRRNVTNFHKRLRNADSDRIVPPDVGVHSTNDKSCDL